MLIELEDALKAMDELEREDIETYGCRIPEGFDAERAKMALCNVRTAVFAPPTDDDCVSRQAVLEAIDVKAWEFCDYLISKNRNDEQKPVSHFADNLRECISEDLPSVTPAEKVGRWVFVKGYEGLLYECTVCKNKNTHTTVRWNYCPHCGAKMQEVDE